jgi:hypothetical protein
MGWTEVGVNQVLAASNFQPTSNVRGRPHREQLKELMAKKEMVSDVFNQLR